MRLVTYDDGRVGKVVDGTVIELDVPDMRRYFELGGDVAATGVEHSLDEVKLRAPIIPKKFFPTAGKFFSPEEAEEYIAGYIVFNDITARDIQREEMKSGVFCLSKSIDTFVPIGPWIVTADEIPDPQNLAMELRVNGESRQVSHTSRMSVTVPEIISHYSAMGYSPGDIISTGTVAGVAGFSEDAASLSLKPGDVVEAEIEGVGVLRNPVISWSEGHPDLDPEPSK